MTLQEIFDQLSYGELAQISINGGLSGEIRPQDYGKMVAHTNLALMAIYKRFHLKEGRFEIIFQPDQHTYELRSKFAVTSRTSREPVRYLKDSAAAPFKDDLLKVERVIGETGFEFAVNNAADPYSFSTPTQRTLVVPDLILNPPQDLLDEMKTTSVQVVYRASHVKLVAEDNDIEPAEVELELPETHVEPLLLFIAARMLTPMGMGATESDSGNNFYQKYELACQQLEAQNLQIDKGTQYNKIERNGWV